MPPGPQSRSIGCGRLTLPVLLSATSRSSSRRPRSLQALRPRRFSQPSGSGRSSLGEGIDDAGGGYSESTSEMITELQGDVAGPDPERPR